MPPIAAYCCHLLQDCMLPGERTVMLPPGSIRRGCKMKIPPQAKAGLLQKKAATLKENCIDSLYCGCMSGS